MAIVLIVKEMYKTLKHLIKSHAFWGCIVGFASILIACVTVSYQMTGVISLEGFFKAQHSNPVIWLLNFTPLIFGFWGFNFDKNLSHRVQVAVENTSKNYLSFSDDFESKLQYKKYSDVLTGLPNGSLLREQIRHLIDQSGSYHHLALIIIKVNEFSSSSTSYNVTKSAKVIKLFTNQLKAILLHPYILNISSRTNLLGRLHSDEFVFLLPNLKRGYQVDELMETVISLIPSNMDVGGNKIHLNITAGISIYPFHGDKDISLINHACIAVYHARKTGKSYEKYAFGMQDDLVQNQILITQLKHFIENNELEIYYLPVIDLVTGHVAAAESSTHFHHPEYGFLNYEQFIPLLEGTNLIHHLTAFMLKGAIQQLAVWHQSGLFLKASVFVSMSDIADKEFPGMINELLKQHQVAPEFLRVEFTERACLIDKPVIKNVLNELSGLGIELGINDFCSGYTSFTYLCNFPINYIKIEQIHLDEMRQDSKKTSLVEAMIQLSSTLGMQIIATGIADKKTLKLLVQLGCHYGQGSLFSEPVNITDFDLLVKKVCLIE